MKFTQKQNELAGFLFWMLICLVYSYQFLFHRMIPQDEGILAFSAEQVSMGSIPHIDYQEPYTGGLAYWHAFIFELFGTQLTSLRIGLFIVFAFFLGSFYYLCRRTTTTLHAGLITLLATLWSIPNYSAAMPSWYCIFFAVIGVACLLRHHDSGRLPWLFAAGMAGAASFLMKSPGLYYVLAAVIFLTQCKAQNVNSIVWCNIRLGGRFLFLCQILGSAFVLAVVVLLLKKNFSMMDFVIFIVPIFMVLAIYCYQCFRDYKNRASLNLQNLFIFLSGFLVAMAPFLSLYLAGQRVSLLFDGLFIIPQQRFEWAYYPLPPLESLLWLLPVLGIFCLAVVLPKKFKGRMEILTVSSILVFGIPILFAENPLYYKAVWSSLRPLVPLSVSAVAIAWFLQSKREKLTSELSLLIGFLAFMNLLQFPYAFGLYFVYMTPALILFLLYAGQSFLSPFKRPLVHLAIALGVFAVFYLNPGSIRRIGVNFALPKESKKLDLERGGIYTVAEVADLYKGLIEFVKIKAGEGNPIYAGPDSPEVAFLSKTRSVEWSQYDIFGRTETIRQRLESYLTKHELKVLVFNLRPEFSPAPDKATLEWAVTTFGHYMQFGHFLVVWRE